jgi:hypothetical protein
MVDVKLVSGVWKLLLQAQKAHKTITYGTIAKKLGSRNGQFLGRHLGICAMFSISTYGLGLNVLAVRQDTGEPGDGVMLSRADRDVQKERVDVWAAPTFSKGPSPEIIRKLNRVINQFME